MYRPFLPYMTGLSSNELPNHGKQQHVNRPRVKERQTRLSNVAPMDSATQVAGNLRPNSFTFELYVRILVDATVLQKACSDLLPTSCASELYVRDNRSYTIPNETSCCPSVVSLYVFRRLCGVMFNVSSLSLRWRVAYRRCPCPSVALLLPIDDARRVGLSSVRWKMQFTEFSVASAHESE